MRLPDSGEVVVVVELRIHEGHREAFVAAIDASTTFVERTEPGVSRYQFFLSDDGRFATSIHVYRNSAAFAEHLAVADEVIAEVVKHAALTRIEIIGSVSESVAQRQRAFVGGDLGERPEIRPAHEAYGFVR